MSISHTWPNSTPLWALVVPPLILSGALFVTIVSAQRSADRAVRREQFVSQIQSALSELQDAETGQRGFLLTGRAEYLEPYERAVRALPSLHDRLTPLAQNEGSRRRIPRLLSLTGEKLAELSQTIELRKSGDLKGALDLVSTDRGKLTMDRLRGEIRSLEKAESVEAASDRARRDRLRWWTTGLLLAVPLLTVLLIWKLAKAARREGLLRLGKQREVEALNLSLEARVAERTAVLEDTNRQLEEFARIAAHDLKSPVRTATAMVEMIRRRFENQLPGDAPQLLMMALDSLHRLAELIEDLLAYQRVAVSGAPRLGPVDLRSTLGQAEVRLRAILDDAGAIVRVGDLPEVTGDDSQLVHLFQNLLENAVKYRRPHEPPLIDVTAARQGREWVVAVRDNGIGFDQQYAEEIFKPFHRLHGSDVPGSGIGLALCAKIAERCGGRMWAESSIHGGSVFYVGLPVSTLAPAPAGQARAATAFSR